MNVYQPSGAKWAELSRPVGSDATDLITQTIDGRPHDEWTPVPFELVTMDRKRRLERSDAPWYLTSVLVLRAGAAAAMRPILERDGEVLPLAHPTDELVVVNPRVLDALDEPASVLNRLPRNNFVWRIEKHVFLPDRIGGAAIFKLPTPSVSPVYVTDEFVDRWRSAALKGLDFKLLWSSGG